MQERVLDSTYRLLEEIGRGGFGAVYRGVRIGSEGSGQVAIKLLNKNPKLASEDYIRFQREATVMSQLIHPGVVTVFELSEDHGTYFIVMEYVSGQNLRDYVRSRGGKISLTEIVDIVLQAAEALDYVHSHAIIHRDIKPQNMLIEEKSDRGERHSHVKLVDFGVARLGEGMVAVAPTGEGVVGTYAYMAPEATGLTQWDVDSRADIYSLGIVAYELIAGKTPFSELRNDELLRAHVEQNAPSIKTFRGQDIPITIDNIVQKCISKNPDDRYQSMFGLICDLRRIQVDLRARGVIEPFEIAKKDIGIGSLLERTFVGRKSVVKEIADYAGKHGTGVHWGLLRSDVGIGKTRCLQEVRKTIESRKLKLLYFRFSESEQRLPLQSFSLAINELLSHYHRTNRSAFRKYLSATVSQMGSVAGELGRFIPILRQFAVNPAGDIRSAEENSIDFDSALQNTDDVFSVSQSLDKRYMAPNQRLNDAIVVLLSGLLQADERFVFLMDDFHLADVATLSFFTYLLESEDCDANFSIVFSMREKQSRQNIILDNFVRRIFERQLGVRIWSLLPFEEPEIREFFEALGMQDCPPDFSRFVFEKSGGSVLQIISMLKQMLAQDALVPSTSVGGDRSLGWTLNVDWDRLQQVAVDFVSIEILLAGLESIDRRDLGLLNIAAISYDACEFEYFSIESGMSLVELEQRLIGLVHRGYLEIVGDESMPIQRRAFSFSHEKIRTAVLIKLDLETRRHIHYSLATRIAALYRTPKKEQVIALAKHFDGAGDKVSPSDSVKVFLRAAKVYIHASEHNQARYYIDKALEVTAKISVQSDRIQKLRDCYEAEYMIQAAQGNLIEASEVCRNLLEITFDSAKRKTLQVFWSHLLLGLGRHRVAYAQSLEVVESNAKTLSTRVLDFLSFLSNLSIGTFLYPYFVSAVQKIFGTINAKRNEGSSQAVIVMSLAHLHGGVPRFGRTLGLAARMGVLSRALDRDASIMNIVVAIKLFCRGNVSQAYQMCEESEYFLQTKGFQIHHRWLVALRGIWIDYPMGKMDRLHALVDTEVGLFLPSSGIMHFESYALRAWLTLMSPSSRSARSAATNDAKHRRKSDRQSSQSPAEKLSSDSSGASNISRRVVDSGENSQYTALTLFSDAARFALSDKIEPLRRAVDQLRRQSSVSPIGDVLADFAFSIQALVLGHQHESLKSYQRAVSRLIRVEMEIVSVVVGDALRFASMILPVFAISFRAKGWPWGVQLRKILFSIDNVLKTAEGVKNPRRSAVSVLFNGFLAFLNGQRAEAFLLLERAIMDSRSQRSELIEAIAASLMGAFSGKASSHRASENFLSAVDIARRYELRLLERYVLGLAALTKVELVFDAGAAGGAEDVSSVSLLSREKQTTLGFSEVLVKMQSLHAASSASDLLSAAIRIICASLQVGGGRAYVREVGKNRFVHMASVGDSFGADYNDRWIVKLLSNSSEDLVRVVLMEDSDKSSLSSDEQGDGLSGLRAPVEESVPGSEETRQVRAVELSDETKTHAVVVSAPVSEVTAVHNVESDSQFSQTGGQEVSNHYLVLLALVSNKSLVGWIAVPSVLPSVYSSRELEQDLLLLGLHVGHLLVRMNPSLLNEDDLSPESVVEQGVRDITDGDIPKNMFIETHGKAPSGTDMGWRVFGLRNDQVIVIQWRISCRSLPHAQKTGEFLGRHMRFFAHSARQSSEIAGIEHLLLKLSSDITSILENASSELRFDDVKIAIVIWDQKERRVAEGDFGGESFCFGGNGDVEREFLQEIKGILTSDRLVYHERSRKISGVAGWMFGMSEKVRPAYACFSRSDFVEDYFRLRSQKVVRLQDVLKNEKALSGAFLAVLVREQE